MLCFTEVFFYKKTQQYVESLGRGAFSLKEEGCNDSRFVRSWKYENCIYIKFINNQLTNQVSTTNEHRPHLKHV